VTKILFKERRTSIEQKDLDERKEIAEKAFKTYKESRYGFSVTQAQFKDSYADILT
jgi:hypothetical protein